MSKVLLVLVILVATVVDEDEEKETEDELLLGEDEEDLLTLTDSLEFEEDLDPVVMMLLLSCVVELNLTPWTSMKIPTPNTITMMTTAAVSLFAFTVAHFNFSHRGARFNFCVISKRGEQ